MRRSFSFRSYLPFAIAIVGAAALSLATATFAVQKIEETSWEEIGEALDRAGHDWVTVAVDGLQVHLSGTAPDEASRFSALAAAGTVIDATRVIDEMDVVPAKTIEAPEFSIEILRNVDGISLIGLIPAASDRAGVVNRLERISQRDVSDLLEVGDYPMPDGWENVVAFALDALERIPRSKVSVTAARVAVTGIVDSEQVRRRVETELARSVPSGVVLALDISAPRPVIAPFTVRFLIDGNGPRFDACAAETPEMRDIIVKAAEQAGMQGRIACQIGLGAPSLEWGEAVAAGIAAVKRIGAAKITYSDADVSLVVSHTVPLPIFDREVGELERALPEGFSLTAVQSPPPEREEGGEDSGGTPEFVATLSPEGEAQLRGRLPSDRVQRAVESYAQAHFGSNRTYAATRLDDALPDGWSLRVLAGLDALAYLANGTVVVQPAFLSVSGRTGNPNALAEISGHLSERLGQGQNFEIDVTYEEALDPMSGIPTPEECVARLNTVMKVQKITFEPGSSTIDQSGLQIIDQLADILRDCQSVQMEIAGHTDSQGRETMNLRLSQERADAVLNAIMARRVLTGNLTAKGYGEVTPIADNDTEEGREANRRIEFTLVLPEAAAETEAAPESEGESTVE